MTQRRPGRCPTGLPSRVGCRGRAGSGLAGQRGVHAQLLPQPVQQPDRAKRAGGLHLQRPALGAQRHGDVAVEVPLDRGGQPAQRVQAEEEAAWQARTASMAAAREGLWHEHDLSVAAPAPPRPAPAARTPPSRPPPTPARPGSRAGQPGHAGRAAPARSPPRPPAPGRRPTPPALTASWCRSCHQETPAASAPGIERSWSSATVVVPTPWTVRPMTPKGGVPVVKQAPVKGRKAVKVNFVLPKDAVSGNVSVVGDFNGWDPFAHPLRPRRDGTRSAVVTLPPGRRFAFRYLAEGGRWART